MPRENRSYRKRSRSRSRSLSPRSSKSRKRRSRSRERKRERRSRSRDRDRRSRSRERRSRSRERKRSRSRDRKRSRSRERRLKNKSPDRRKRSRTRSPKYKEGAILTKDEPLDKEAEQNRLESEMQKRRDRIENWRAKRKKEQGEEEDDDAPMQLIVVPESKKWSLEDESDEDEPSSSGGADGDEVDPLDAYMQEIETRSKKEKAPTEPKEVEEKEKVTVTDDNTENKTTKFQSFTGVATRQDDPSKTKGELMESNADAMEYSSEEEEETIGETMAKLKDKKKDLFVVDHTKVYYRAFRKNFYVEVPELARMTQKEVDTVRAELEDIKVRGKNCPKPMNRWAQCGVSKKISECLKKNGFEKPTPIQAQAIPVIMSGRDLIGIAKTGSGKTLAFLMPMFRHILDQPPLDEDDGPIVVIMTPTRELALQITKECKKFTKQLGLAAVCVYGGTGISEQIAELKRGCEIIVCTPGRMIDMLSANSGRVTNLRRCTYVVLDEADRMFDLGFEPQVTKIMDNIRPDRQTVMFSATFPRQMEALARKLLQKPIEVLVGGRSVVCKDVEQNAVLLEEDDKFFKLLELLGLYQEKGAVLVFVDKQEHADELLKLLMKHSYPCLSLHGGIDQYDRDSTITDFKQGNCKLMIATSVAARGLDVKDLILVVNYDCPNHYEDYVHRCGRTGRAGNHGYAYTFLTQEQVKYAGEIIKALENSDNEVPAELQKLWDDYVAKALSEGKKVKSFSGFHGKGFKFDETEAQLAQDRKKLQKAALGLADSDDEDSGVDIDQQIEEKFASVKRVIDVAKPLSNQAPATSLKTKEKLEMAKRLAAKINMQRNLGAEAQDITQVATLALMKGVVATPQVSAKTIAEEMAGKLNAKIGYRKNIEEEKEVEPTVETFKRYEEELEINDFPQTARWKVTSKEALSQISEYSEAGITVRGTYFPPKVHPKEEEERKLYLAIEATSDLAIQKAKKEITRLIKEELIRLQNSYQPINKGRYKVV